MPDMKITDVAVQYGKHDMERLGLFIEMPYMNGKGYVSPFPKPKVTKGRNILGEGRKTKNGTQHGYFDKEFRRLFIGEGLSRRSKKKKPIKVPFLPGGSSKWHSCPGDYFGCFSGRIASFGARARVKKPPPKEKPNCLTNPGKKGGPGYANICLSKYPIHMPCPYPGKYKYKKYGTQLGGPLITVHYPQPYFDNNPFIEETKGPLYVTTVEPPPADVGEGRWNPTGPAKWPGGCHDGLFEKFPEYISNRDKKKEAKEKQLKLQKLSEQTVDFYPQSRALKTMFTTPVMPRKTDICVNATNYKTYEANYIKRLVN